MSDTLKNPPYWSYEQRFEILTERGFEGLDPIVWEQVVSLAGATVIKEGRAPTVRHFVLSTSSLFVFPNRAVLLSCAKDGIVPAIHFILDTLAPYGPCHASLERRLPVGKQRLMWNDRDTGSIESLPPVKSCSEAGIVHTWSFERRAHPPTTLAVLMYDLERRCEMAEMQRLVNAEFPEFLFCGHRFGGDGFSFNAVSRESYLTMHYTPGAYASFECCITDWEAADRLLEKTVGACRPEVVVPVWYGTPPGLANDAEAADIRLS